MLYRVVMLERSTCKMTLLVRDYINETAFLVFRKFIMPVELEFTN